MEGIEGKGEEEENVVVKEIEMKGEGEVRKIWEELGVGARIEEIKDIGSGNGKERKMVIVKMKDRKGKMEVMRKKIVEGRVVRIEDDWTREERAM